MPTTPDGPDGSDDPDEVSGAADVADRETVPVDVSGRETRRVDVRGHPTVRVDTGPGNRATVKLPSPRRPPGHGGRAPLAVATGVATVWAALLTYVPVAAVIGLARTFEGAGGLGGAAGAGLAGWLLGHGVPLGTTIGSFGLTPLLLTLVAVWRLNRAGLHVSRAIGGRARPAMRTALTVAGSVGLAYAVLGLLAAVLVDRPGLEVSVLRAAVDFFGIGACGALVGAVRHTGALRVVARRIPPVLRHGLRTGVVGALLIAAAGAAFAGLAVAVGGAQAADIIAAYRTGVTGQAGITLVSLAYGGNAAVWAAAYLLGPGFLLGADTAVRVTEVTVGPLPTLPLLAGLPDGPMGATGALLLSVPVLAGMSAGVMLTRRLTRPRPPRPGEPAAPPPAPGWGRLCGASLIAGPVAGLVLGALAHLSAGPLGDGRLARIGPVAWQVTLVATIVVAVSAMLGALAARTFARPRRA
ncbi:cell division protein PerM [Mangrovihabitans endophyticus]|uniref:Uncharacterized protein n=1 Tax=Mangrovihabitans endophyticus TaxID=1751298 RepID=A0A8J3BYF7_9ACTN|nr:DUF6350 family protein [Mangrovihabitans endophyticus]GGK92104.1 hypothetical protein GCM10012284_27460 [Mangrovihabitans endophyticus]